MGDRGAAAASTCPCGNELRNRLHDTGVEVVTVALDVDADDARPFIEKAAAPSIRR